MKHLKKAAIISLIIIAAWLAIGYCVPQASTPGSGSLPGSPFGTIEGDRSDGGADINLCMYRCK